MTDRVDALILILDEDLHEDGAALALVRAAAEQIRGVRAVELHAPESPWTVLAAEVRLRTDIADRLIRLATAIGTPGGPIDAA